MRKDFIQASGNHFERNGEKVMLRGWALGSWMNFEHFMMGLPGTNSMILDAFREVYGEEKAREWLKSLLVGMVSEKDISFLKGIGINSIRIPFGYHHFIDDSDPDTFLEEGFGQLDRVVQLCAKNGMYVILDLHSTPGSQNNDWHSDNITGQSLFWRYRCFQDQVIRLWRELSARYADNPWVIGYDVINEPHYDLTAEQINGFYRRAAAAIRENDPDHILFLEGTDFGRDFAPLEELDDPQVAYTVHFYPFVLKEDVLDPGMDDKRRLEIFTEIFDRQLSETKRLNRPIWCGESGYEILDGQEEFYGRLLSHNVNLCEERGISWNLWTYKDAGRMGIVVPRKDSDWMKLREKLAAGWSHDWEQKVSMEITHYIGDTYYRHLDDKLTYDLDFRVRSILHRIAVEQILKPALRDIPWDSMKSYPDSFAFDNCVKREVVIDKIKTIIMDQEKEVSAAGL